MLLLLNRFTPIQRGIIYTVSGILLSLICISIKDILFPFFIAFIFSYLLNPVVDRLEFIFQKRIIAVISLYIAICVGLIFFFNFIIPLLLSEFNELSTKLPLYGGKIKEWSLLIKNRIEQDIPLAQQLNIFGNIETQLQTVVINLAQKIPTFFISTFSTMSYILLIPIILFFFLFQGPDMKIGFYKLIPNKYFELLIYLFSSIGNKLGNYLRGIFIETIIIGILTAIMLITIGADYAFLLGTLAGITNLIPYIGPLFGAIPAIIIFYVKLKSLNALLYIILGFVIVQTIDNIILKPIIYSQSVNLHPLSVLFFLILGGMIAGVWGLILAVPIAGILKVCISIIAKEVKFRVASQLEESTSH